MLDTADVRAIVDLIVDNSATGLTTEVIADLFGRLVWILSDNGAALCRVMRSWLDEGSDLRRVQIALAMEEVFFYERRSEMQGAFLRLTSRYPELDTTCKRVLAAWDASGYPDT